MFSINKKVFILLTVLSFFLTANCFSQSSTLGKIISYKKITSAIEGKTINAIFDVHVYNDNIIRIRISKNKKLNNFSYALVDTSMPSFNGITIEDKGNIISLSTKMIIAEIAKQPFFKITFKDKNGNIIN